MFIYSNYSDLIDTLTYLCTYMHAYKVFINSTEFSIGAKECEPIDEDNKLNHINYCTNVISLVIVISQDEYDILNLLLKA